MVLRSQIPKRYVILGRGRKFATNYYRFFISVRRVRSGMKISNRHFSLLMPRLEIAGPNPEKG